MRVGILPRFEKSTYNQEWMVFEIDLVKFFTGNKCEVTLINSLDKPTLSKIDLLVLSGGATPGSDLYRDKLEKEIYADAKKNNKYVLGICRGAQLMAKISGSELVKISEHLNQERKLFEIDHSMGICFHNWSIRNLGPEWEIIARDSLDNSIEIFRHKNVKHVGVMSHPERKKDNQLGFEKLMELLIND